MSNDPTDQLPDDAGRTTAPILEQLVAEVRLMRADVGALRAESRATRRGVDDLGTRLDRLIAETRAGFRRELGAEAELTNARLDRLEADVRALKEQRP
jgi:outer membrane murein-binding lipoprotein Lpp